MKALPIISPGGSQERGTGSQGSRDGNLKCHHFEGVGLEGAQTTRTPRKSIVGQMQETSDAEPRAKPMKGHHGRFCFFYFF